MIENTKNFFWNFGTISDIYINFFTFFFKKDDPRTLYISEIA